MFRSQESKFNDLIKKLAQAEPTQRLRIVVAEVDLISNFARFESVFFLLQGQARYQFFKSTAFTALEPKTLLPLYKTLLLDEALDEKQQLDLFYSITVTWPFKEAMELFLVVPDKNRIMFALAFHRDGLTVEACLEVMACLPKSDRVVFYGLHRDKFLTSSHFYSLLGSLYTLLPEEAFLIVLEESVSLLGEQVVLLAPEVLAIFVRRHTAEIIAFMENEQQLWLVVSKLPAIFTLRAELIVETLKVKPFINETLHYLSRTTIAASELTAAKNLSTELAGYFSSRSCDLVCLLNALPEELRAAFAAKFEEHIKSVEQLIEVLLTLPRQARYDFALSYSNLIPNGKELFEVLKTLPNTSQVSFAAKLRYVIKDKIELTQVFSTEALSDMSLEDKRDFVKDYIIPIQVPFLSKEEGFVREAFTSLVMQQLISMQEASPNWFLITAAAMPKREDDFKYFLTHPLCSAYTFATGGHSLESIIKHSNLLSDQEKIKRIEWVMEKKQSERLSQSTHYMVNDVTVLNYVGQKFNKPLPKLSGEVWDIAGVEPIYTKRFQQLTKWLIKQEALSQYKAHFEKLSNNELIRVPDQFKGILDELEKFVCLIDRHLSQASDLNITSAGAGTNHVLHGYFNRIDGLDGFASEVKTALAYMSYTLSPSVGIVHYIAKALDHAVQEFAVIVGIPISKLQHISKDYLFNLLGIEAKIHLDKQSIFIWREDLAAIAGRAMSKISVEHLIQQGFPCLEIKAYLEKKAGQEFSFEVLELLLRDWQLLYMAGVLPEVEEIHHRINAVLSMLSNWNDDGSKEVYAILARIQEGQSMAGLPRLPRFSASKLYDVYTNHLMKMGVLKCTPQQASLMKARIWSLLTKIGPFSEVENTLWTRLLTKHDGLFWVQNAIEAKPEKSHEIRLESLLYQPPGLETNLFRKMACNPYLVTFLCGFNIAWTETGHYQIKRHTKWPLSLALTKLVSDKDLQAREHHALFHSNGNVLFWLGQWQKDLSMEKIYQAALELINKKKLYQFARITGVLQSVCKKGEYYDSLVQTFLTERANEQKTNELWDSYWQTLFYIKRYKLTFDSEAQVLSLKSLSNARAALCLAGSMQSLVKDIMSACTEKHLISHSQLAEILMVLKSISPVIKNESGRVGGIMHLEAMESAAMPTPK